jgi:hypothetical protein
VSLPTINRTPTIADISERMGDYAPEDVSLIEGIIAVMGVDAYRCTRTNAYVELLARGHKVARVRAGEVTLFGDAETQDWGRPIKHKVGGTRDGWAYVELSRWSGTRKRAKSRPVTPPALGQVCPHCLATHPGEC